MALKSLEKPKEVPAKNAAKDVSVTSAPAGQPAGPRAPLSKKTKRKRKISKKELVHITSQIAIMTQSGVDIVSAISSLIKQTKTPDAKAVLTQIHSDVTSGHTFSRALAVHNEVFGNSFVASVTAGEASGRMSEILAELAKLNRNELRMIRSLKTMAAYPIVLVCVSLTVIASLLFFVLPQFAKIFSDFDTPLPLITQILIGFSEQMVARFYIWVPLAIALVFGTRYYLRTPMGKRVWDFVMLNAFVLKEATRTLLIGRVCRLLGLLLNSGVPLLESLQLVRGAVNNSYYRDMLTEIEKNVLSGKGLGKTLHNSPYVPDSAAEMILTAEKTGTLGDATQLIGEHFEEEGEEKMRGMIVVLEPAITVVMGAVVAFVVLAVALPMFDLANVVQK